MAQRNFTEFRFGIASATASTALHYLDNFIDTVNGLKLSAINVLGHAAGDRWEETLYAGIQKHEPIVIEGHDDDVAASGPTALLSASNIGGIRRFEYNLDTSTGQLLTGDVLVIDFERMVARNAVNRYRATLQPTGTLSTAS